MIRVLFLFTALLCTCLRVSAQTCTANHGPSGHSSTTITAVTWTGSGISNAACASGIASGTINATLVIDMANAAVLTISSDLTVNGSFLISGGTDSELTTSGAIDVQITGNLGDNTNNGVIYSVPDGGATINADGTVFGKNSNAFNGNGNISGGTLDVKNGTTCGTPCPVEGNFDSCTAGDTFCEDNSVILPIVLGNFGYVSLGSQVELEWETISEENFDFFSIERSDDGKEFYEIGTVPGHGNSNTRIQYSFVDENPIFGISFYRLNAIDYDGSYEKFQSIAVEYIPNNLQATIYPNPGNGQNMKIRLGLPKEARLKTVSLYDLSGERILEKDIGIGKNELSLQQHLTKGLYFAKIQIDNYIITKKLIIE